MDIIVVPGLWLDASSWSEVIPTLEDAGHRVRPLTLPGVGVPAAESSGTGIGDWVEAVVTEIDAVGAPVVLVGHSAGGNVVWGATDARPGRVARVVLVDTIPAADGAPLPDFDVRDGVVPFPGWDSFPQEETSDLDAETRSATAARMRTVPAGVSAGIVRLTDPARFTVPVTLLMGSLDRAGLEAEIAGWERFSAEYGAIDDVEVVTIGSGHWPQFSVPAHLAALIAAAVARR